MIDIKKYNSIGTYSDVNNFIYPIPHVFVVSDDDYKNGFIDRFFVQKINGSDVIEVNSENYVNVTNSLYIKTSIPWNLTGSERNVYKSGKLYDLGVYEKNKVLVESAAKTLPEIKKVITNYTLGFRSN
jgi:hypothetical protein